MISSERNRPIIAVAVGDIGGIGPEVALKALATELKVDGPRYLLLGDENYLATLRERLGLNLDWQRFTGRTAQGRLFLHSFVDIPVSQDLVAGSSEAARAALAWLRQGAELCLRGEADALVTAPVNKESIIRSGEKDFVGQTEFLSAIARTERTAMMLLGSDDRGRWLRVVLATTHVPIARLPQCLTREKVELAIDLAAKACQDLGLSSARIAVCGLNPHAGEHGTIGAEEMTTILPAVEALRNRGFDVVGPLAADALFYYAFRGHYDVVIAMYHDQGLVPLKMIGFENGVNWTVGLPFIRTSPDHGTGYDIAGKGIANPSSMISAMHLAGKLAEHHVTR